MRNEAQLHICFTHNPLVTFYLIDNLPHSRVKVEFIVSNPFFNVGDLTQATFLISSVHPSKGFDVLINLEEKVPGRMIPSRKNC
ncbi:hypothetical protein D3C75_917350 [compost metagenome]